MRYIIPQACNGMLLRTYLCQELGLSRRLLIRLKGMPRGMLLDGHEVTVRAVLHEGQELSLAIEDTRTPETSVVPEGTMPPVLYEDDDILICNKPGNMPTHPSHGHFDDTLANAVAAYDIAQTGAARIFRPITRLDRETSGAVLIARGQLSAAKLSDAMQARALQKTYLAILDGVPECAEGLIDAPIRRACESIILREVCDMSAPGAQAARTRYRVLAQWTVEGHMRSLVAACLETGRTHQLRVHFAHLGAPIAGDGLYGRRDYPAAIIPPRQCLHAYSLAFRHPSTGKPMTVIAPIADDILRYIPADTASQVHTLLAAYPV